MQKGRDDNRDYRRITEKSLEKRAKNSFYFYTVMILSMLFFFSAVGIFANIGFKYALLFIIIDGIYILSLAGLVKYRKDRKMVDILGDAGILVPTATFLFGIVIIEATKLDIKSIGRAILVAFIVGAFAFISLLSLYRRYRELKQEETGIPAVPQSTLEYESSNYISDLKANWDNPILSPVEWEDKMIEVQKGTGAITSPLLVLGISLIAAAFLVEKTEIFNLKLILILAGTILLLFGFLTLFIETWAKKQIKKENDIYLETKASWNITDFDVGKEAVEEFLQKNGYSYRAERNDKVNYPDYRYILESGTYLHLVFIVQKHPIHYFGWFGIGYKLLDYNEARKLQQELDEYLTERDILLRSEMLD